MSRKCDAIHAHIPITLLLGTRPSSPTPLGELTIHTLVVENVHNPQLMFPGHICYLASQFADNFLRND